MANSYQVTVIGGGPGGYVAAIRAAQLGFKTALIEKSKTLGGTCLNIGCIPSKALLASTEHFHFAQHRFAAHGIQSSGLKMEIPALMKRKEEVVKNLTKGIDFLMKKNKIDRISGFGRLVNGTTIEVDEDGKKSQITSDKIILATGSEPIELPFLKFDGNRVLNSTHALALDEAPKSLLVIGGGAIGLELGLVWSRLGTKVTVVEFLPRIASGFDHEASALLQRIFTKQGFTFHLETKVTQATVAKDKVVLDAEQKGKALKLEAEKVLVAVGRRPYVEGLGLDKAGVALTEKGRVKVNEHWQTSVPSVYAIGDMIDGPMLAHKAEDEGVAVAEHLAGKPGHVNYDFIPGVIYTSPEVASVGLTEEQAKEKKIEYRVGKFPFMANGRALASDTTDGFAKIIADAKTDRVLGVHIVASNASELIASAVLLMEFGGSSEDLARTIHAHPSMSEAVKEAALGVAGRAIHA
ncbi:MAG: dihydrolipoyl dehydrogenase [Verrucomicrobiia bacterium]